MIGYYKNIMITFVLLVLLAILSVPATTLANENQGGKYYLPFFIPVTDHGGAGDDIAESPELAGLKGPADVKAGEMFIISLLTKDSFPRLLSQEVAFFESYEGSAFELIAISNLDRNGKAELELQKEKAGAYSYKVEAGPLKGEIEVTVLPSSPARIKVDKEIFLEVGKAAGVEFILEDSFGNRLIAGNKTNQFMPSLLQVSFKDLHKKEISEVKVLAGPTGNFVASPKADKIGDFLVDALIKNSGIAVNTIVHVRDFGSITGIELSTKNNMEEQLRINGNATKRNRLELELTLVSQYGFKRTPSSDENINIIYFTNFPALAEVEKTTAGGAILLEKGKPGIVTVTATYLEKMKGLQDSINIWIGDLPSQLYFNVLSEGLTAKVEATLLDRFHQPTFENTKDYDIITPEGIKLVSKKELEKGKAEFVLEAAEFGSYNIGMTVKDGISGSLTLSFEESAGPAGHVVFFVGQKYYFKDGKAVEMSDPPYLNYGHVFVPAQFIADTFAAEILPNSSPQKLLFKGKDIEMEINQTEQKITVMEKGKEKTTPIGPLFLQKKNNVYFIPAVMIGNLLGAEVDFLPKEGEIEHVTFIKKP